MLEEQNHIDPRSIVHPLPRTTPSIYPSATTHNTTLSTQQKHQMGGINDLYESFVIYSESVSYFYLLCVCTSFAAVFFAWRVNGSGQSFVGESKSENETAADTIDGDNEQEIDQDFNEESQSSLNRSDSSGSSTISRTRLSHSNKRAMLENLNDNLDETELATEKEVESQQLANIFEFMKKEADKFDIGSLEELEDQMRQYYKK